MQLQDTLPRVFKSNTILLVKLHFQNWAPFFPEGFRQTITGLEKSNKDSERIRN